MGVKSAGLNEEGKNSTLEFKYLRVPFSVLWDAKNGNPHIFALQITLENGWVYPAGESASSWYLIMFLNPAETGTIRIYFGCEMHLCTFSAVLWDCGTLPRHRLWERLKLWAGSMLHSEPVQWHKGTIISSS